MRAWHFHNGKLRDGSPLPEIGVRLSHARPVVICQSGLHASKRVIDALKYAPGNICDLVECEDIATEHEDKFACRHRTRLATVNAEELFREFARWCAISVIDLWQCPPIVRQYLVTGNKNMMSAALSAALSAAESAARSAAWSAAWSAARSAAWSAAWSAARSAAWSAAESAAESAALSAARSAAWSAAESAAESAARSAAWSAARSAAWSAAESAQNELLEWKLLREMGVQ